MCEHELDVMGCEFVMPGNWQFNGTFESCEAEVACTSPPSLPSLLPLPSNNRADPPGVYVTAIDGESTGYSTFRQYYTGVYTADGTPVSYTVGTTVTPAAPQMTPSSSNCQTFPTITNGVGLAIGDSAATGSAGGSSGTGTGTGKFIRLFLSVDVRD